MARIDTLNNFLTDVADAIREKTGDENPIQAQNFDTEIESIQGGIDIQNGQLVHYKATNNTVPAGTFVKLNTSYSSTSLTRLSANEQIDYLLNMGDFIVFGLRGGSNPYYYDLGIAVVTASGFSITQYYRVMNGQYTVSMGTNWVVKLDNTHFVHFIKTDSTSTIVKYAIYEYSNNVLAQVTSGYTTINYTSAGVNNISTNYPNIITSCAVDLGTEIVCHIIGSVNRNDSTYKGFVYGLKINKTDYTLTYMPNVQSVTKKYGWNLIPFKDDLLIAIQTDRIIAITPDYQNNTYTFRENMFSGYNFPSTAGTINYIPCVNDPNSMFLILKTSTTTLKYTKITVDTNNNITGTGLVTLDTVSSAIYNYIAAENTIVDGTKLVYTFDVYGRIIENINDNELAIYTYTVLNDTTTNGIAHAVYTNNGLFITSGLYTSGSSNTGRLYLCTGYIDNDNMINQGDGSAITVAPATGTIQGITTTECTTSTAGDVYLLDTSS